MRRLWAKCPKGTEGHVEAAIASAADAFPAWSALGAEGRLPYLQRFAEEIGKRKEALCEVESTDAGILLSRLQHGIIPRSMLNITWFAEAALTLRIESWIHRRHSILCAMIPLASVPLSRPGMHL
jgi:5-carboxymethyl-2-hydroxymuconic-semialdehyde dehydrogenase